MGGLTLSLPHRHFDFTVHRSCRVRWGSASELVSSYALLHCTLDSKSGRVITSAPAVYHKPACKNSTEYSVILNNQFYLLSSAHTCELLIAITGKKTTFLQIFLENMGYYLVFSHQIPEDGISRRRDQGEVVESPSVSRYLSSLISYQVLSKESKSSQ